MKVGKVLMQFGMDPCFQKATLMSQAELEADRKMVQESVREEER